MKRYAVRISERVSSENSAPALYIARDSVENALAWEARLTAEIAAIGDHAGHAVDEAARREFGRVVTRMVFERTYLVFYTVDAGAGVLEVIGFRHGMRLPREGEA